MMNAVVALSPQPGGFHVAELAAKVSEVLRAPYTVRQASYDLEKLRAKGLVTKRELRFATRHPRSGSEPWLL